MAVMPGAVSVPILLRFDISVCHRWVVMLLLLVALARAVVAPSCLRFMTGFLVR